MTNTTTAESNLNIEVESTLKKTNLGDYIIHHKNSVIALFVSLIIVLTGFAIYKNVAKKNLEEVLKTSFTFSQDAIANLKDKKLNKEEFLTKYNALDAKIRDHVAFLPFTFEIAEIFITQNEIDAAVSILQSRLSVTDANSYAFHFISLKLATLLEDQGKNDEVISILEKLILSKVQIYPAKVYFDLGRLYLAKGDTEKAKNNFNHILNTYPKDEFADLSKLYLSELK